MITCKLCNSRVDPSAHEAFDTCDCGEVYVDASGTYLRSGAKTSMDNIVYEEDVFSPRAEACFT